MSDKALHTPGPWQWAKYQNGESYLVHPYAGWLVVMDCVRLGMQNAQPRFATWKGDERENMGGIMVEASKLDLATHPDARLIAAAPDLLTALSELLPCCERMRNSPIYRQAEAALAKARGED